MIDREALKISIADTLINSYEYSEAEDMLFTEEILDEVLYQMHESIDEEISYAIERRT